MGEGEHGGGKPAGRATAGLDPIGQALRATYDADNHDSLGKDLTGLMLELTHVATPAPPAGAAPAAPRRTSWLRRLLNPTPR